LLNRAQCEAILSALGSGVQAVSLAARYNVSPSTIYKLAKGAYRAREDNPRVPRLIPIETKREIHRRANAGEDVDALAVEFQLATTTIRKYAAKDPTSRLRRSTFSAPKLKLLPQNNFDLPRHVCEPYGGTRQSIGSCVARREASHKAMTEYASRCRDCKEGMRNARILHQMGVI
jgi:hypothetical protein